MTINTKPVKQKKDIKSKTNNKSKVIIHRVKSEPKLQEKTVTSNGTVLPDMDYDGLKKVTVNVSGGGSIECYRARSGTSQSDSCITVFKWPPSVGDFGLCCFNDGVAPYTSPYFDEPLVVTEVNSSEFTFKLLSTSKEGTVPLEVFEKLL